MRADSNKIINETRDIITDCYRNTQGHERLLWKIICQPIRQPRRNG